MTEDWPPGTVAHVDPLTSLRIVFQPGQTLYQWCLDTEHHTHYWFRDHWVEITPEKDEE